MKCEIIHSDTAEEISGNVDWFLDSEGITNIKKIEHKEVASSDTFSDFSYITTILYEEPENDAGW